MTCRVATCGQGPSSQSPSRFWPAGRKNLAVAWVLLMHLFHLLHLLPLVKTPHALRTCQCRRQRFSATCRRILANVLAYLPIRALPWDAGFGVAHAARIVPARSAICRTRRAGIRRTRARLPSRLPSATHRYARRQPFARRLAAWHILCIPTQANAAVVVRSVVPRRRSPTRKWRVLS